MIFGEKQSFAVECELTNQDGQWIYGKFRLWLEGLPIGTYSEELLKLVGTTGRLRKPIVESSPIVAHLGAQEFLGGAFSAVYGEGVYNDSECRRWQPYIWFAYCEGFDTVFSVAARVENNIRIVWRATDQEQIKEQYVPYSTYSTVCSKFMSWLDHGISERGKATE